MFQNIPPAVKNLLIINGLMFLALMMCQQVFHIDLNDILGLHYLGSEAFKPYQLITYMFMHGSLMHIFFNMFALFMFGRMLEQIWGAKKFLIYYFVTGIGAVLIHALVLFFELSPVTNAIDTFLADPNTAQLQAFITSHKFQVSPYLSADMWQSFQSFQSNVSTWQVNPDDYKAKAQVVEFMMDYRSYYLNLPTVVGASGAVFGILLAFGMTFPNVQLMLLFPPIPIKAKWFVMGYGAIELYYAVANQPGDNVAHFAHLGGMIFGFALIKYWNKNQFTRFN